MAKKMCAVCDKKLGFFSRKFNIADGIICSSCFEPLVFSEFHGAKLSTTSAATIKEYFNRAIQHNQAMQDGAKNQNAFIPHAVRSTDYKNYSRFLQKWDDSYNKDLGYEWFRVCVERVNFPIYNGFGLRLVNIRKALGMTQTVVAKSAGMSASTLSSYENSQTAPPDKYIYSLSSACGVPFDFLKHGYVGDFREHIRLCRDFGETEYLNSLIVSTRAACTLFPEMLSPEEIDICELIDIVLNLRIGMFNEYTKARNEMKNNIRIELLAKLEDTEVIQSEFCKPLEANRELGYEVIKELHESGIISKDKKGSTFILRLIQKE